MGFLTQGAKPASRAAVLITFPGTDRAKAPRGQAGRWISGKGATSQHVPVGTWWHCSSPRLWQKGQDALRLSSQTASQWLWGFGGRVKGRREMRVGERQGRDRILTGQRRRIVREIIRGSGREKFQSTISEQMDPDVHWLSPRCICASESLVPCVLSAPTVSSQYGSQKGGSR